MSHLISQFSEAQYQSFIESCFIEDFRNNLKFDIYFYSGVEEKLKGYDIMVDTFIPIFMQMKRSNFFRSYSSNKDMIARKTSFGYRDQPGAYYFHLHVDSKIKDYLQHNLLVDLCSTFNYARYVAPLFIDFKLLMRLKYSLPPILWNNIYSASLLDKSLSHSWKDYLLFPHSILIKPHSRQTKAKNIHHKYFFNRAQ